MAKPVWPWPDDTREDRYRRIIDHYRNALAEADLDACLALDKRMADYGQSWVSDNSVVDVNAMMSAREIAERFDISEWNVRDWHRRHPHLIMSHKGSNGRRLFRLGDVLTVHSRQ